MGEFSLPANIKQIGSIGDGLRIYMEDYAFTYLNQFADAGGYSERIAYLIGRHMVIDGQAILFINGAIQGKDAEEQDGLQRFTEASRAYAEAMRTKYFDGMEIVGWMQSQPSYGLYLNQRYAAYHRHYFTGAHQVMFVMDPMERLNTFYMQTADKNSMSEVRGYFIYYDKNASMHEYMLNDKTADYTAPSPAYIENGEESATPLTFYNEDRTENPEEVIRRHQENRYQRRGAAKQRRSVNLLVGLSAVLFVVCFVMGAGLIQNQDRIAVMEEQLVQLSTAYRNLFAQVTDSPASPVYAEQRGPDSGPTDSAAAAEPPVTEVVFTLPSPEPSPEPTASPEPAALAPDPGPTIPETYTIQPGDSLIAISTRFYNDEGMVREILTLNGIENADLIQAGKTIALPRR